MGLANALKDEVLSWPGITARLHQFSATEFRFGQAEVCHVHLWGDVDIPFPRAIRDLLVEEQVAEEHRWVPNSGWTTFHMRNKEDVGRAVWLSACRTCGMC